MSHFTEGYETFVDQDIYLVDAINSETYIQQVVRKWLHGDMQTI